MSRVQVPAHLADLVRCFAADFGRVTAEWVRDGWHTPAEVDEWRDVIRKDMQNEFSVNPVIDPRTREERIRAWCKTFRDLAWQMRGEK